jgi:starch synthase (maltosyl-transferring)
VLWYGKLTAAGDDAIFVAVNLDPFAAHAASVEVPLDALGLGPDAVYRMRDLLGGGSWEWRGRTGLVRLDPAVAPAHVFVLER